MSNEIQEYLQQVYQKEGILKPSRLVELAKEEDCPIHDCFEWDDSEAAMQYRLDQARSLIRSVKVEFKVTSTTMLAPRYVHDPRQDEGYMEIGKATPRPTAKDILTQEEERLRGALVRYLAIAEQLQISTPLVSELKKISHHLNGKQEAA